MKLACQAIQTVTVELLGVLMIVGMLFGFASWGLRGATGNGPTWNQQLVDALDAWRASEAARVAPLPEAEQARADYVAERLDHYSQRVAAASKNMLRKLWPNTPSPESALLSPEQGTELSLLGRL